MPQVQEIEANKDTGSLLLRIGISGSVILWFHERFMRTLDRARLVWHHLKGSRRKIIKLGNSEGDRYAIVASYGAKALPRTLERLLPVLKERGLKIILSHNGRIAPETLERLKPIVDTVVLRPNVGRDLGAFQDGVRYLQTLATPPKRVLFVNDSVFLIPSGLSALLDGLDTDEHHYVGCTENFQFHYHVSSFLFSISGSVFQTKAFKKFWKTYFPYSTRHYSIHHGEVRLTQYIKDRAGFAPKILYSMHDAGRFVRDWTLDDLEKNLRLLPLYARDKVHGQQLHNVYVDPVDISIGPDRSGARPASVSSNLAAARDIRLKALLSDLIDSFEGGSQTHLAFGIFFKYLNMPLVKKDLVYRGIYNLSDVMWMMSEAGYPDMNEVEADFRRRSYPVVTGRFRQLLYAAGVI